LPVALVENYSGGIGEIEASDFPPDGYSNKMVSLGGDFIREPPGLGTQNQVVLEGVGPCLALVIISLWFLSRCCLYSSQFFQCVSFTCSQ